MPIVPDYTSRVSQFQAGNIYYANNTRVTLKSSDVLAVINAEPRLNLYQRPLQHERGYHHDLRPPAGRG